MCFDKSSQKLVQMSQSDTKQVHKSYIELHRVLLWPFDPARSRKMGLGGIVTGSIFGFSTKFGSNVLRKVPLMQESWEYVLLIGAGAFAGSYLEKKYYRDVEEVEEIRQFLEQKPLTDRKTE
uniref:Uncharacterized protein AlNc14C199G8641 n=1 Tax=Albugo laibachii Nc14 TaxID=890382 RepID=F0WQH0_9STRA|nr:unknown protein putative [Albugo laibachii Nc14]|eukprot:CCA23579.1 unknown protein putative [Albugo laibachii Nc14]